MRAKKRSTWMSHDALGAPQVRHDDNPTSRRIIESDGAVWPEAFARGEGGHCRLFEIRFT
jgi:hypothetical protein